MNEQIGNSFKDFLKATIYLIYVDDKETKMTHHDKLFKFKVLHTQTKQRMKMFSFSHRDDRKKRSKLLNNPQCKLNT